jgi:lipoxygenase homology domain-containing protein 1
VFITLYGENGDSGERELRKSNHRNKFERNQVDEFELKAIELGELLKLKIRIDESGFGSAWYLEKIEISNPDTQKL